MSTSVSTPSADFEARFAQQIAAHLSAGTQELPHDITERLRAARVQAVARRKVVRVQGAPAVVKNGGTAAALGGWWIRMGSLVPLVALVLGLVLINWQQDDRQITELAEVDAALLSSDLPPAAYTDPGFTQFLKAQNPSVQ